jgi:hypothetical protein
MDHDLVVRDKMTEKYLLEELDPALRDQFEEHFFTCPECALDVRAGAEFVTKSKAVLSESSEPISATVSLVRDRGNPRFGWFRPAFAGPLLALLTIVILYQNLVTYPQLRSALNQPKILPWASVNVGTYGSARPTITVAPGKGFLLFVRIPPDATYAHYSADLYNSDGKLEWSLTIPAIVGQDQWPVQIPEANRKAGTYNLSVRGITAAGEGKDLGSTSFELQIQK